MASGGRGCRCTGGGAHERDGQAGLGPNEDHGHIETEGAPSCLPRQSRGDQCLPEPLLTRIRARSKSASHRDVVLQAPRAGAWLWCSKDDKVIDAVRKVSTSPRRPARCEDRSTKQTPKSPPRRAPSAIPTPSVPVLQMTKGNVGSLLVFDPSKVDLTAEMTKASGRRRGRPHHRARCVPGCGFHCIFLRHQARAIPAPALHLITFAKGWLRSLSPAMPCERLPLWARLCCMP